MGDPSDDAFVRLLTLAQEGGSARVDAIVAVAQRELFVPTWISGDSTFRSVISSSGVAALPVYSSLARLDAMARQLGWTTPDGQVPHGVTSASSLIHHALARNLLLLVDMGFDHSLELDAEELQPVAASGNSLTPGPFAGSGKLGASLYDVVQRRTPPPPRPSSSPGSISSPGRVSSPEASGLRHAMDSLGGLAERANVSPSGNPKPSETLPPKVRGTDSVHPAEAHHSITLPDGVEMSTLAAPPDALLDALRGVLRAYPEVEWASLANVARPPTGPLPTVCLRLTPNFRTRVAEITTALKAAAASSHASLDVTLLDEPAAIQGARSVGKTFFPWRR